MKDGADSVEEKGSLHQARDKGISALTRPGPKAMCLDQIRDEGDSASEVGM